MIKPDATTTYVWKDIEELFHENKDTKAIELDDELHNIVIRDSSIINGILQPHQVHCQYSCKY